MGSQAHAILILFAIIGGILCGAFCMVFLLLKLIKLKQPQVIVYFVMMIMCILIVAASWILNIGWLRFILILLAVPFIHPVIFTVINAMAIPNVIYSARLKVYTLITDITYVLMYAFFPDGGDTGPMYVFFGLIKNDSAVHVLSIFSAVSLIVYIIFTTLQIIETVKTQKRVTAQNLWHTANLV